MFVSIINDCNDQNAMNRQATRVASLFGASVSTLGVSDFGTLGSGEIEAAGNLIDTLDASNSSEGVILVNVANRHGKGKKWPNGTPFCYFYYKKTLIISTIDGYSLSLIKKMKLVDSVQLMDIPTVIDAMIEQGHFDKTYRRLVVDSQFRSYEFIPRVAKWLFDGIAIPSETLSIDQIEDMPDCIWWVDNFGNCVTSLFPEDVGHEAGKKIQTQFGEVMCYQRLKDVPNGETGLIVGSSGIENRRFLGFVIQGKSAAAKYNIKTGMPFLK
ncbi:MAG: SAM hydroxide adenosyltransferase [Patescibacteria group bacterium]